MFSNSKSAETSNKRKRSKRSKAGASLTTLLIHSTHSTDDSPMSLLLRAAADPEFMWKALFIATTLKRYAIYINALCCKERERPLKRPDTTMFVLHVTGVHNDVIISLPFKLNSTKIIHQTHEKRIRNRKCFFLRWQWMEFSVCCFRKTPN